ncbi:MAG: MurR/RpiR family transcriptional regulator [Coprobacillaceae bacterium]
MNTLLERLVVYCNTCLKKDINYEIARYILNHYDECESITLKRICEDCYISRTSVVRFCELFNFSSWSAFHQFLTGTKKIKTFQAIDRFKTINIDNLYRMIYTVADNYTDEFKKEVKSYVNLMVDLLFKHDKVYLFGAIYPLSLATAFQVDMIGLGKLVYSNFQNEGTTIEPMQENDLALILTASGRYISEYKQQFNAVCHSDAKRVVMSCSNRYKGMPAIDYYVHMQPSKDGGVKDFDYYLSAFLDIVYVEYRIRLEEGVYVTA